MTKARILLQLDTEEQPSVFDSVVAIDAGVEQLLRHGGVKPDQVRDLVFGALFTRGMDDLKSTAIFIGGTRVDAGEALLNAIRQAFFGPFRVSVLLDSNGANTTSAAAVLVAAQHVDLSQVRALVLGATGSVGRRVARLLARQGAEVRVASRDRARAEEVCRSLPENITGGRLSAWATMDESSAAAAIEGVQVVVAAGAAGAQLLPEALWKGRADLRIAIDLNAVPPAGIGGIEVGDRAAERDGVICYGAVGVGGTKMKIHKAAIRRLFEANNQILDAEEVFELGRSLTA